MKHKIIICMGSSCFARGNERNIRVIQDFLKNNCLEAEVEFIGTHCENICSKGPNISIDGVMYNRLDSEVLLDLLNDKLLEKEHKQ